MSVNKLIKGTFIFASAGLICRIMGFVFRIFLSRIMSPSEIGLCNMVMPICILGQSIAAGGLTTAVSKYTAAYMTQHKKDKGYINFLATLLYCTIAGCICSVVIAANSGLVAHMVIKNDTCRTFLIIAAYSIPFGCLHTVISSYFIGLELHHLPAISQILEQVVRIISVYIFSRICVQNNTPVTGIIALYGILAGEISSSAFSLLAVIFLNDKYKNEPTGLIRTPIYYFAEGIMQLAANFKLGMPISLNRICAHIIQSLEAFILPMSLVTFGLSNEDALATYGIITGMTLPLLLFPATLTNSMSQALLPDISKAWERKDTKELYKSINLSVNIATSLGFICITGFYYYGSHFGEFIFKNPAVSEQIKYLCILCPFIFVLAPVSSILNAIGKSGMVLITNLISQTIRLFIIVFFIPHVGINGFFAALIISHALSCIILLISLKKITGCTYSLKKLIVAPAFKCIICFFATFPIYSLLSKYTTLPEIITIIIGGASFGISSLYFSYIYQRS